MGEVVQLKKPKTAGTETPAGKIKFGSAELISRYNVREELLVLKAIYEEVEQRDPDLAGMITEIFCDTKACAYFRIKVAADSPANLGFVAHIADGCVHTWVNGHNGILVKGTKAEVAVEPSWPLDDEG